MAQRGHYGRWSENDLLMAIAAYKKGETGLNECSRKFGVPKATIKRHADRNNHVKALGRQATFSSHMEKVLSEHILQLEKCSFGLTANEIRKLAFDVAEKHSLPHTFSKEKKIAGKKWFYAFMRRNPQISSIKTSTLETSTTSSDSESSSNDLVDKETKHTQLKNILEITDKKPGSSDSQIEAITSCKPRMRLEEYCTQLAKKPRLQEINKFLACSKKQSVNNVKVEKEISDFKFEIDDSKLNVKQESSECLKDKVKIEDSLKKTDLKDEIKIKVEIDEDIDEGGFEFVDVRFTGNHQIEPFHAVNPIS